MTLQEALLAKLKSHLSDHLKLADELGDLLDISTDSAYRRLRGETSLSIDEVAIICSKYRISFDSLLNDKPGIATFHYNPLFAGEMNFESYLLLILGMLQKMQQSKGEIIYAAEDVPVIRSLSYPRLAQFKIYYWLKSVLNDNTITQNQFELGILPEKYNAICDQIRIAYNQVSSVEIWTEETLYSTLKQIEFFWQTGKFKSKDDAMSVWEDMCLVVNDLKMAAENETKDPDMQNGTTFKLYDCEVLVGNNCIILQAGSWKRTFISYNSMNSLNTEDEAFNDEASQWMQNLIKKSSLMSGVGEKHRFRFFKLMSDRLQHTLDVLNSDPF
jgi:hypothetical protein